MKVSVIISTYSLDRLKDTEESIASILAQTYTNYELIVVMGDNPHLMTTLRSRFRDGVKFMVCETKGLSAARNAGVDSSTGDIVAFLDDDAVADSRWLEHIVDVFKSDDATGAVTGPIEPLWMSGETSWLPEQLYWIVSCTYMDIPDGKSVENLIGTNMAFRREIYTDGIRFSETLGAKEKWKLQNKKWVQKCGLVGEERDFCIRLMKKGWKIQFSSGVKVKHRVYGYRITMREMLKRGYWEGFSKGFLAKSNPGGDVLATEKGFALHIVRSLGNTGKGKGIIRLRQISSIAFVACAVALGYAHFKVSGMPIHD